MARYAPDEPVSGSNSAEALKVREEMVPITGVFGSGRVKFFTETASFVVPSDRVRVRIFGGTLDGGGSTGGSYGASFGMKVVAGLVVGSTITVTVPALGSGIASFGPHMSVDGTSRVVTGADVSYQGGAPGTGTSGGGGGSANVFGSGATAGNSGLSGGGGSSGSAGGSGLTGCGGAAGNAGPAGSATNLLDGVSLDYLGTGAGGGAALGANSYGGSGFNGGGAGGGANGSGAPGFPGGGAAANGKGVRALVIVEW